MHVILVEQNLEMQELVSCLLVNRGHIVKAFDDPRLALACLKSENDADALISSDELMHMSGLELCWEGRLLATNQRPIYIILMSSGRNADQLIEALDCGADDIIGRPPAPEQLSARLRAAERLISMQRELIAKAQTDPLTGLLNRRAFFQQAGTLFEGLQPESQVAALMIDIDHFKQINDVHGHAFGDEVLCEVAEQLKSARAIVGRLGGEEFAVVLENSGPDQAFAFAEQLRLAISALPFVNMDIPVKVTASFGMCEWHEGESIDQILKEADRALYAAKSAGRNRTECAGRTKLPSEFNPKSVIRVARLG